MYIDVLSAFDQHFYLKIEISFLLFLYYHVSFILLYSRFHRTRRSYVMMTAKLPLSPTRPTAGEGAAKAMFRLVAQ